MKKGGRGKMSEGKSKKGEVCFERGDMRRVQERMARGRSGEVSEGKKEEVCI